jgi:N-acetyl-gamma-glutamyl-phosphate reductase
MSSSSVAIFGASGFSGAVLAALIKEHPFISLDFLGANTHAGQSLSSLYPALHLSSLPTLSSHDTLIEKAPELDAVFCCLPHNISSSVISNLLRQKPQLRIVDLSASLRIKNPHIYQQTYNLSLNENLIQNAVYGLPEIYRNDIKNSSLIANPGCYTTASLLPLIPLLHHKLIEPQDILIDAKSGVSGAGRKNDADFSFCHINNQFKAYALEGHRHEPEINQELSFALKRAQNLTPEALEPYETSALFIPHLVPMSRGILCTLYTKALPSLIPLSSAPLSSSEKIWETLAATYQDEPFVHVLPFGEIPSTAHTLHSNKCTIGVAKRTHNDNRHIIVSVIDNLMKGASGQALQNLNIMMGWPETTGLQHLTVPI